MSVSSLLKQLRPDKVWTREARALYVTRRFLAFFETYPELIPVALGTNPSNRVLWDGFYRFFYRRFPERTDEYQKDGKLHKRSWWFNEEVHDPRWDRLLQLYHANRVYTRIIVPYLRKMGV